MRQMLAAALMLGIAAPAFADGPLYQAIVMKVIDGDTLEVVVPEWPLPFRDSRIRIYGIDTPESTWRTAKCEGERKRGQTSKSYVKKRLPPGTRVDLEWMGERDKYGRVIMRVWLEGHINLGRELVAMGLASDYHGRKKRSWCATTVIPMTPSAP